MSTSEVPPTVSQESRTYGHIPGIRTGEKFKDRAALLKAGVHGQLRAGIHGDPKEGAFSICVSGGYEDNRDLGSRLIYVGAGGKDEQGEKQIRNQTFDDDNGNQSLYVSCQTKRPVRVIRGAREPSLYAPLDGFRYDGLYVVDLAEMRRGKAGFEMCFFELRRIIEEGDPPTIPSHRRLTVKRMIKMLRKAPKN